MFDCFFFTAHNSLCIEFFTVHSSYICFTFIKGPYFASIVRYACIVFWYPVSLYSRQHILFDFNFSVCCTIKFEKFQINPTPLHPSIRFPISAVSRDTGEGVHLIFTDVPPCSSLNDTINYTVFELKTVPDDTVNRTEAGAAIYRSDCCTAEIRILTASSRVREKYVSRDYHYNDNNP